jgi:ATP-dependent helicase IRC3
LALNKRNIATVSDMAAKAVFGLTATLEVKKQDVIMRAFALCGPVVYTYPLKTGIDDKILTPGVSVAINVEQTIPEEDAQIDYTELYRKHIVGSKVWNEPIRQLVIEGVKRHHAVIVIVERVAHVCKLTKQLQALGVLVHSIYGAKSTEQRKHSKMLFELGEVDVLIVNKVFQKGVDIKRVSVIIDATAGYSKNNAVQRFGRGVRLHHHKKGLLHFDIGPTEGKFRRAAKSRRRALRAIGIRVKESYWKDSATAYDLAENQLKLVLKGLEQTESKPVPTGNRKVRKTGMTI